MQTNTKKLRRVKPKMHKTRNKKNQINTIKIYLPLEIKTKQNKQQ